MKKRLAASIGNFFSCTGTRASTPTSPTCLDVQEEYANAFRTESYNEFWKRVLASSNGNSALSISPMESTTADRLSSYRMFAEQLLDPDQFTVARILELTHNPFTAHTLLSEYFSQTANVSILCGLLLKDIDKIHIIHRSFKTTIQSLEDNQLTNSISYLNIVAHLVQFSNSPNPFSSPNRIEVVQLNCSVLHKQLESGRNKTRLKLRLINRLQHGSGIFLVALTASLVVIVASHGLALLVGASGLMVASLKLASRRRLAKVSAWLDAATKGAYILNRDLDTISRLMARLNDELEDMRAMVKFWVEHGEDRLQTDGEVTRQLKKNDASFSQQLDELEEHLYLCLMTINRARMLVMKEILDSGQSNGATGKM